MGMIWLLKALADISAFYLFTAPLASYFGGGQLLLCGLLQGLAYGLARQLPKKWLLPLPAALLAGCYALCWGNLYDLIAITPATGYLLWQFFRKSAIPDFSQQQETCSAGSKHTAMTPAAPQIFQGHIAGTADQK